MIRSAVLTGIDALAVEVEIALDRNRRGGFGIFGLGRREVQEGGQRLQHAIQACGFQWPEGAITVNLAPADVPKSGTTMDLAMALTILEASGQIHLGLAAPVYAVGELGLDGTVRPVRGALPLARSIPDGSVLVAPKDNSEELALLRQIADVGKKYTPYVVQNLVEAVEVVEGRTTPLASTGADRLASAFGRGVNFSQVIGQERAKRALEVAAAGGHNVLLVGPPGEGKTLLAKALPTILPALRRAEILELTAIYSAAGELPTRNAVVYDPPYRVVHHTTSPEALVVGGQKIPSPGEITLAHRGVLFLDEMPEFRRGVLETLRQPLEDGCIHLQRVGGAAQFPCELILVAAMNPCPCARDGEAICKGCRQRLSVDQVQCLACGPAERQSLCGCTESEKRAYKARLSGAILDRIDLKIRMGALSPAQRFDTPSGVRSKTVRKRVEAAREIQLRRYHGERFWLNARVPAGKVRKYCELHPSAETAMREVAAKSPELNMRGHDKLLKTARTIADLNNSPTIYKQHMVEAAELCGHESVRDRLNELVLCPGCNGRVDGRHSYCPACGGRLLN